MVKTPLCPKHRVALALEERSIVLAGTTYDVCIGLCTRCKVRYIDRQIMACANVTIDGQKYEYLPALRESHEIQQRFVDPRPSVLAAQSQEMDDIEQFFLTAETETHANNEVECLTAQNAALHRELAEARQHISDMERQHAEHIAQLQSSLQRQADEANQLLAETQRLHRAEIAQLQASAHTQDQRDSETERLTAQNETLQRKLNEARQRISDMERQHKAQITQLRSALQRQSDDANHQMAEMQRLHRAEIAQLQAYAQSQVQRNEDMARLGAQNEILQGQLVEATQRISNIERQHSASIAEIQSAHQAEVTRLTRERDRERASRSALSTKIAAYETKISHLSQIRADTLAQVRSAALAEFAAVHQQNITLQQRCDALTRQVETLQRQLAEYRKAARTVVFVDDKLYVCGGRIRCDVRSHHREEVNGVIDTVGGATVTMTVSYCKDCKLYYVRDTVFASYRNKHGSLLGHFVCLKDGSQLGLGGYGELAPESLLHMNGYNVNQAVDLSTNERRKILTYVIESRIMSKADIRNHLSFLIKQNQSRPNMSVAVSRWQADMMWVNDYHAGQQSTVWLRGTAMYRHRHR